MNRRERWSFWWMDRRCSRWDETISLGALGLLDDTTQRALDQHIRHCSRCAARFESARGVALALGGSAEALEAQCASAFSPSAGFRERWASVVRGSPRQTLGEAVNGRTWSNFASAREAAKRDRKTLSVGANVRGWLRQGDWVWAASAATWLLAMILRVAAPTYERGEAPVPRVALSWREVRMALDRAQPGESGDRSAGPYGDAPSKPIPTGPARPGSRSDAGALRIHG